MSSSPDRTAQLERDLRAAAGSFDDTPISSDAWQQNQRRLAGHRGGRGRVLLAVAAVVVLIALVGGAALLGGGGPGDGIPAAGGDEPFGDSVVLGPPVEVETLQLDGQRIVHEAVLSDTSGKGPSLCDRYVAENASAGGCTSRDPDADDPAVAFDWLTGTSGGGDIRGVLGAVDDRVAGLQVWMNNGDMTAAALGRAGWQGTQIFGLTVPADGPRPQRLVAYADGGKVLQAVDLGALFGQDDWLGGSRDCSTTDPGPIDDSGLLPSLTITPTRLGVFADAASDIPTQCLHLGDSLQGFRSGRDLVLLVPPEVLSVHLRQNGARINSGNSGTPATLRRVLWRIVRVHASRPLSDSDIVIAQDSTGTEVSRQRVSAFR